MELYLQNRPQARMGPRATICWLLILSMAVGWAPQDAAVDLEAKPFVRSNVCKENGRRQDGPEEPGDYPADI